MTVSIIENGLYNQAKGSKINIFPIKEIEERIKVLKEYPLTPQEAFTTAQQEVPETYQHNTDDINFLILDMLSQEENV